VTFSKGSEEQPGEVGGQVLRRGFPLCGVKERINDGRSVGRQRRSGAEGRVGGRGNREQIRGRGRGRECLIVGVIVWLVVEWRGMVQRVTRLGRGPSNDLLLYRAVTISCPASGSGSKKMYSRTVR
jgi:hypothetical protein